MSEEWRPIKGYEGLYEVSNHGNVRRGDRILKNFICGRYCGVALSKNGKGKKFYVHRLVAETFIPNPLKKRQVNHIDGNKLNNTVVNLEWCTHGENQKHAWDNGLKEHQRYVLKHMPPTNLKSRKSVDQYTKSGIFLRRWESQLQVMRELRIDSGNIAKCCKGKAYSAGGYIWRYTEQ